MARGVCASSTSRIPTAAATKTAYCTAEAEARAEGESWQAGRQAGRQAGKYRTGRQAVSSAFCCYMQITDDGMAGDERCESRPAAWPSEALREERQRQLGRWRRQPGLPRAAAGRCSPSRRAATGRRSLTMRLPSACERTIGDRLGRGWRLSGVSVCIDAAYCRTTAGAKSRTGVMLWSTRRYARPPVVPLPR